ncbi:MAG: hypothetical protein JSW64_11235 [Candidatus Zixiibacteriota bacterium]|nr:MAG: hypothetical protein JSW64_11235 [candidate division Zixibacteria bacterium]
MNNKRLIRFLLLFSLASLACGGGFYLNKNYTLEQPDNYTLAIMPLYGDTTGFTDSVFSLTFTLDAPAEEKLLPPNEIRFRLFLNEEFNGIYKKIVIYDHSKEEKKSGPNLKNCLNNDEIIVFQEGVDNANIIIVPIELNVGHFLNYTTGNFRCRLYDLNNGDLIYDKSNDLNVNLGGEQGRRHLVLAMFSIAYSDYNKYFLDKQIYRLED